MKNILKLCDLRRLWKQKVLLALLGFAVFLHDCNLQAAETHFCSTNDVAVSREMTEYLQKPIYTSDQLNSIKDLAESILKKTTSEDVIVFIGRSLYLVPYYWDVSGQGKDRNYHCVSFSGGRRYINAWNNMKYTSPAPDKLDSYKSYLEKTTFLKNLKENVTGRLVLVDYAETGLGIAAFLKITQGLFPDLTKREYQIIAVGPEDKGSPEGILNQMGLSCEFYPVIKGLQGVFMRWEYSLPGLCHYDEKKWGDVDPFTAEKSGRIDLVLEHARYVWGFSK